MKIKYLVLLSLWFPVATFSQLPHKLFKAQTAVDTPLPNAVDNSKTRFFPPIFNQIGGSCAQASGVGYMLTYEVNRMLQRDATASASNRFSYLFSWNMINEGEDQGDFVDQGLFLSQRYGIMSEADYGTSGTYQFKWATGYDRYYRAMKYRVREVLTFADSVPLMKRWLFDEGNGSSQGGVLTFSGYSTGWHIDSSYDGPSLTGYKSLLTQLATDGAHAMTIVGYDDEVAYTDNTGKQHNGAFIVVNSWGPSWQDNGHYYLPYDFFRDHNRNTLQLSNTVEAIHVYTHEPKVVFKIALDYTSRNDISFQVASDADINSHGVLSYHRVQAFNNAGGDYPMQGQYLGSTIELALDLTDYMSGGDSCQNVYLNVLRSARGKISGTGSITALSVMDYRGDEVKTYAYPGSLPLALNWGNNEFTVKLKEWMRVSASPYRYIASNGAIQANTFRVRTAQGHSAKMKFDSSSSGMVKISYKLNK